MLKPTCVAFILLCTAALTSAQVPAGGEFRINSLTTQPQLSSHVAAEKDGDFVVAWISFGFPGEPWSNIVARRFDATGAPRGPEFLVNTYTTLQQILPAVDVTPTGRFVVVWSSYYQDGSGFGIFGQRFDSSGQRVASEFQVNVYTTGSQQIPSVAIADSGAFVVTWVGPDPTGRRVLARRYDASGAPLGPEFAVDVPGGSPRRSRVAATPAGSFVVVWDQYRTGAAGDVVGQRFDGSGTPVGATFLVNTYTTNDQQLPTVTVGDDGAFVVAWTSWMVDGQDVGVAARAFDAAGAPRGPEFQVNTYTTFHQTLPEVAIDAAGNFTITWYSFQDGDRDAVIARRYHAAATPRSDEFRVNTYTTSTQDDAHVASDPQGNLVITWSDAVQDGSGHGVFARRYGGLQPARLALDTAAGPTSDGNGVLEACEAVDVRPAWRNVNGAALTFAGSLASLTGPPGATYSILDGSGDYGTVANAATANCTDCYAVAVSCPPSRPVVHWDIRMLEAQTPDVLGLVAAWKLHVGESFADVPRASGFYRFVEALLHHSVTAGCTGTTYCPAATTSREQMSVFVLVSKEGAGYRPPACTTPLFTDVPAASPFCRFIEEMARRGAVSGCGGGNFCPQAAVSREEMAVFVLRALDPTLNPPACTTPVFGDVPASSPFCRWIEELVRRGIASGCGGGNYCPASPVTRDQMAVFLGATFGLTLYGP